MKKTRKIFLIISLLILVLMFWNFGFEKFIDDVAKVGWKFSVFMGIYLLNHIFLTYGWRVLITVPLNFFGFIRLLIARIAGDSTTLINAAASAAGDPLKALYIKNLIPFKKGLASVVLDRMVHVIGNFLIIIFGVFVAIWKLGLPLAGMVSFAAVLIALMIALVIYVHGRKNNFLFSLVRLIPQRLRRKFITPKRLEAVHHIDEEIAYVFSSRSNMNHFYVSLFMHSVPVMLAGTFEVYFIMAFAGYQVTVVDAMFIYLFGLIVTVVLFFVPLNIATSEGSYVAACVYLGYDKSLGLTIGFLRRARAFLWSLIGVAFLFSAGMLGKDDSAENSTTAEDKKVVRKSKKRSSKRTKKIT